MKKVDIWGDDGDYSALEEAFKAAGVECWRETRHYRGAGAESAQYICAALATITAVATAIASVAKSRKKRFKIAVGPKLFEVENYSTQEVEAMLPTARAIFLDPPERIVEVRGDADDYVALEAAFKDAGIEYKRCKLVPLSVEAGGHELLLVTIATVAVAIAKAATAIADVAKARKRRLKIDSDTFEVENYSDLEVRALLPSAKAISLEASEPGPASKRPVRKRVKGRTAGKIENRTSRHRPGKSGGGPQP